MSGLTAALTRLVRTLPYAPELRPRNGLWCRGLFDAAYYRSRYSVSNALLDFFLAGAFEGRNPHPLFDTAFYLRKYPDVAAAGVNPLAHYLKFGAAEWRKPHPLFQPDYYLSACPEARRGGDPLAHFLRHGGKNGCNPHPLFDCESYLRAKPEAAGVNPLVHYARTCGAGDRVRRAGTENGACHLGTLDTARFEISDVNLLVVFLDPSFEAETDAQREFVRNAIEGCSARGGILGEIVLAWRTCAGQTRFLAPPQQRPFFEAMRYDQLRTQVNGTLDCRTEAA